MITIRLLRDENKYIDQYIIDGHSSNNDKTGMICAGVSSISQTVTMSIQKILKHKIDILSAPGFLNVHFHEKANQNTNLLTETMVLGLRCMEKKYPGQIVITDIMRK